jgi:surface carbohydrate biosynthesis protein (TIGR04326 family)
VARDLLFVFDETLSARGGLPAVPAGACVRLLPLTARPEAEQSARRRLEASAARVELLPAGRSVAEAAAKARSRYIGFIAELPRRCQEAGADMESLFAVDGHACLWWFSLVAEKNTVKSDAFHRLAQAEAAVAAAREAGAAEVWLCLGHRRLERFLESRLRAMDLEVRCLQRSRLRELLQASAGLYLRSLAALAWAAGRALRRGWLTRLALGGAPAARKETPFLFLTYYPNLDRGLAEKGVFRNAYCVPLQESLKSAGLSTTWLAIFAPSPAASFDDGLRWAAGFRRQGTDFFMAEQFAGPLLPLRVFWEVLRAGWRFHRLRPAIKKACAWDGASLYPILAREWYDSFAGAVGFEGLWFYRVFQEALRRLAPREVLYYQEMHAWEKALIAADAGQGRRARLVGYQHAATPWMLLNYFNSPSEIAGAGPYPLPRPDLIVCNGEVSRRYMRGCGWPEEKLALAEAVRFPQLEKYRGRRWDKKDAVMLILSINIPESAALLHMAREALQGLPGAEVWVKPHPFLRLDLVWRRSGLTPRSLGWRLLAGPVEPWLEQAKVVVAGESSVTLEALACGCRVVVVNTPELANLSPLLGRTAACLAAADSSEGLREAVLQGLRRPYAEGDSEEGWRIVDDFFCLAKDGAGAPRLLDIIMGRPAAVPAAAQGGRNG